VKASSQREADLFAAARQLTAGGKRDAFLARACGGDPELRARIEGLLRTDADAADFFSSGRTALGDLAIPSEFKHGLDIEEIALGSRLGRYVIREKLGEGGWGTVYLVEQEEPFRRRVALKIVHLDLDSQTARARFEAERQALAMMDHPNIARVYDAGATPRGTPYFVLELVQGTRITDYCDRHRLTVAERLDLFVQVCHAIQHAHQKGIVHGDIKPGNILITLQDGLPVPKVIDFGVSRTTERQLQQDAFEDSIGPLIGTPAYMSPEQAQAGSLTLDTRSDIYSLGVLLYELLTGATPFTTEELLAGGLEEMRFLLREQTPQSPSHRMAGAPPARLAELAGLRRSTPRALVAALRGDLDAIALKCLEKEPQRRYETANALGMDVVCHQHDERVLAHPAHRLYRLRKLVRRNRFVFAAGAAVTLALVAGLTTSTWLLWREREARQRAVAAEQRATTLRQQAEEREQVTQAQLLTNQERYDEADRIVEKIQLTQPSVEAAAVLRTLGEWHALQRRWRPAADRFQELIQVNQLDTIDQATLDYLEEAPVLVELNDRTAYERFRHDAITRFAGRSVQFSDRILKASLLLPAERDVIDSLPALAEATEVYFHQADAAGDAFQAAWRAMSLAVWHYRAQHYAAAIEWSQRCLSCAEPNAPRTATAQLILALAENRRGKTADAQREFEAADTLIQEKCRGPLVRGTPVQGFWFDWEYALLLQREARGRP
jgi:hypothetical protein